MKIITRLITYFLAIPFLVCDLWKLKEYTSNAIIKTAYYAKLKFEGGYLGHLSKIDGKLILPHGFKGVFISGGAVIGANCTIYQHVTIGSNTMENSKRFGCPTIGNNVFIGAGAIIIGNVKVGNDCKIGAGAVVVENVPDGATVVAPKALIIREER